MTPLPKHLRQRRRYLGIELCGWPNTQLTRTGLEQALRTTSQELLGDVGAATVPLSVLSFIWDDGAGEAVVRTTRESVEEAEAVIATLTTVDDDELACHVRGVSGTVRGCEEKYLGRHTESTRESTVVFEGAERSAVRRRDAIDIRIDDAFVGATSLDLE